MGNVIIVTDSTADLDQEMADRFGIHVVPLTIQINGQTYLDRVDLEPETFLELMRTSEQLPKSSQPAVGVFTELYDKLGSTGDRILSIHMTGGMSGTVKSAQAAAELTEADVTVVDSRFISHGLGFQVMEAAELAQQGKTVEEITERLDRIRENTSLFVVVDTLDNLVKGGRIGKGRAMIGSLLKIKPIASLEGGEYTPVGKARSHKQVVEQLMRQFSGDTASKTVKGIGIAHANGPAMAEPLRKRLEEAGHHNIRYALTTPVISTHAGEGAVGFMYYTE